MVDHDSTSNDEKPLIKSPSNDEKSIPGEAELTLSIYMR